MGSRVVVIIPARYESTRLPGKPLADLHGQPMIQRVYARAQLTRDLDRVLVATDDERIRAAVSAFGGDVVMTSRTHRTGTDRIAEVAAGLGEEIVVNIQGDEPLVDGFVVDAAVEALEADPESAMSTVVHPADPDGLDDPNRVKVALDFAGRALYFSRSRIPYPRDPSAGPRWWQHVGLYAYRRPFLLEFVRLAPGHLERIESLEQLRAMEHGYKIRVAIVEGWRGVPVDVPEDVARVEAALREAGRC